MEKQIGVIEKVSFGLGGYQEAEFGLSLQFTFKGSGVCSFISGGWSGARSEYTKWTENDRSKQQAALCNKIMKILSDAKVDDVTKLKGKPVEVTFEGNLLKDWRILTEAVL